MICSFYFRLMFTLLLGLPLVAGFTAVSSETAFAHDTKLRMGEDPRDRFFGRGAIPKCDDPRVLSKIQGKFYWADKNTWSDIAHRNQAVGIDQIRHIKQRYRLDHTKSMITHRHCNARAHLTSGKDSRLYYMIRERMGFASLSWKVEFCISGYDRWRVYGSNCSSLR